MIKRYDGAESKKMSNFSRLPNGGYVAEVKTARTESYTWGDVLILAIDIAEGEFKNFFKQQYDNNTNEDRKWKGTFRINIPGDKSRYLSNDVKKFNNLIFSFENSNPGFHFDWDEQKLKGKLIGVIYRKKEFTKNDGSVGEYSEAAGVTDIQSIRDGSFSPIKDKRLSADRPAPAASSDSTFSALDDEDLPF